MSENLQAVDERRVKERAAAVAVAVALTSLRASIAFPPQGVETTVSPWQTVMRSHQLKLNQPRGRLR